MASDLLELQRAANALMPSTAVIWRMTYTDDTVGGGVGSFSAVGTFSCLAMPTPGPARSEDLAGRDSEIESWTISLPAYTDVRSTDYIVAIGGTFDVVGFNQNRSYEASRVVSCIKR